MPLRVERQSLIDLESVERHALEGSLRGFWYDLAEGHIRVRYWHANHPGKEFTGKVPLTFNAVKKASYIKYLLRKKGGKKT